MVGVIVTGHGNFASGICSSVNLIMGNQDKLEIVDFIETYTVENLYEELDKKMNRLSDCNEIIVLSDLTGGSPFKTAVEVGMHRDQTVEDIGGCNLGMLIEVLMSRKFVDSLDSLVERCIEAGKQQISKFELVRHCDENLGEGI